MRPRLRDLRRRWWRPAVVGAGAVVVLLWVLRSSEPRYAGRTVGFWLVALNRPDYRERAVADAALRSIGPEAIPALERALRVRESWLGSLYERTANRLLRSRGAQIPKAGVREQAALLLGRLGTHAVTAAPGLVRQLTDADPGAARGAQTALRRIGLPALPSLLAALESPNPNTRRHVLELLGDPQQFGPTGGRFDNQRLAAQGADEPDFEERPPHSVPAGQPDSMTGFDVSRRIADPSPIPRFIERRPGAMAAALRDPEAEVRATAATALGRLGMADGDVLAALEEALCDPVVPVRLAAARALGELGPDAAAASAALATRVSDADARVRVEAARALWRVGRDHASAVPVLVEALEDPDVHWQAALALSEIGPAAGSAVPALLARMEREIAHRPARTPPSAALALAKMGPEAVPGLADLLRHRQAAVRVAAAQALGGHGAAAHRAVPELVTLLSDPDNETRIVAANTLGAIGPPAQPAVPPLRRLVEEGDEYLRAAAVSALDRIGPRPISAHPVGPPGTPVPASTAP